MTENSRTSEQTAAESRWLLELAKAALPGIGFAIVHVTGGVIALAALRHALQFHLLLQILWDRVIIFGRLPFFWLVIPASLGAVAILAAALAAQTLRRWWRRQLEPDVFLRLRVLVYVALACVLFNAFVVSVPETFKGPFRVRFPILAEITAALAYGVYAAWTIALPRLRRGVPRNVRRGLDILCMNAAIVLILTELALRLVATFWSSPILITESSPSQIRRDSERLQPGASLFGFPINSGGHHDTEFKPRSARSGKTVVSIGDSFSYGIVPHAFHFTTIAERESPGLEIYNMGYPGTGPTDYIYLLKDDALPLEPDLVTVQIFVGNDVNDGVVMPGTARWYDADSYLIAVVWYRLQIVRRARKVDLRGDSERSDQDTTKLMARYPWLADPSLEPAGMGREVYLQLAQRNALSVSAKIEGVYERFFEALAAISHVGRSVPVAFVLIPDEYQIEDDLWREIVQMTEVPLERDRPQRLVVEFLKGRGVPVLDLLPVLRAVEPMQDGRRHLYHLHDPHFNARGNLIAGRALARFLDSLLSVPRDSLLSVPRKKAPLPVPAAPLPFHLEIGDSTARRWMLEGWDADEGSGDNTYAWSRGARSILAVPLPPGADIRMDFQVLPFAFPRSPAQRVTIAVNGTVIDEVQLRPDLQSYSVILPARALGESPQTLEFRYAYARAPRDVLKDTPDERELAVAWYRIDFARVNP